MTSGKPSQLVGWFLVSFLTLKKLMTQRGELGLSLNFIRLVSSDICLFLSNAFCRTSIQVRWSSIMSRHFTLDEGVPQGSVLSVLLFALGFNDIVTSIPATVNFSLYVDDLALYIAGARLPFLERQLQLAIENISQWASSHGFHFSPTKTSAVKIKKKGNRR